jgi:uncharacterized protein YdaU (DUF1376 family)
MHYYKRNIGDYAKKAGRLSMLQHGSYTLLIDSCYDREQFPTRDEAIEWTWASSSAEVEAVDFVLRKFFTLEDGVYVQKRIQEEIAEYHAKSATNTRIAIERETKRAEKSTKRAPVVHEAPPNQEPLTINQEPEIKPTAAAVVKKLRRCVLPDDFEPNEAGLQAAAGLILSTELVAFRNHHEGKGTLMVDWQAAWRTWVGNARKFNRSVPTGETPYQRSMRERAEEMVPSIARAPPGHAYPPTTNQTEYFRTLDVQAKEIAHEPSSRLG